MIPKTISSVTTMFQNRLSLFFSSDTGETSNRHPLCRFG
jgi:hypothetical protein